MQSKHFPSLDRMREKNNTQLHCFLTVLNGKAINQNSQAIMQQHQKRTELYYFRNSPVTRTTSFVILETPQTSL